MKVGSRHIQGQTNHAIRALLQRLELIFHLVTHDRRAVPQVLGERKYRGSYLFLDWWDFRGLRKDRRAADEGGRGDAQHMSKHLAAPWTSVRAYQPTNA